MRLLGYIPPTEREIDLALNEMAKQGHEVEGAEVCRSNGLSYQEDKEVFLGSFLAKAFPDWSWGRQGTGDCVSWSQAHCVDVLASVDVHMKQERERIVARCSSEVQYGFMRIEAYGGKQRWGGAGATGSGAAKGITKFGSLYRMKYKNGKYDFSNYSGSRAISFGRTGVPDELEEIAAEHKCATATLVRDFETAAKLIANGYPVNNCHQRNPTCSGHRRDENGFPIGRVSGAAHSMTYIGVRFGKHPALFKTNTGHGNHVSGPSGTDYEIHPKLLQCGWWESPSTVNYVLSGNDSYAYSGYEGFKRQELPDLGFDYL